MRIVALSLRRPKLWLVAAIVIGVGVSLYVGRTGLVSLASETFSSKESRKKAAGIASAGPDSAVDREKKKAEAKRLEAINKALDESTKKSMAEFAAKPPPLVSVGPGGRLTTEAIERLKLTQQEIDALTKSIADIKSEAEADFVNRAKLVSSGPGENGGDEYIYFVRARPDRGKQYMDSFAKKFDEVLDTERSKLLMSGIGHNNQLGIIGQRDMDIKFVTKNGATVVSYKYLNPKNGALSLEGQSTFEEFKQNFGDVFEFPQKNQ